MIKHAKKILMACAVLCASAACPAASDTPPKARQSVLIDHVQFLAGLQPTRSVNNVASLEKAARYIKDQMELTGCTMSIQSYQVDGDTFRNVVCSINPTATDRYVIGAHYDSYHETPGADDNATGVAAVLELVHMLDRDKPTLPYGLDLVAFTLEEPPHFGQATMGSAVYASIMTGTIKGMISIEMIGYFSDQDASQELPMPGVLRHVYPTTGNFIGMIGRGKDRRFLRKSKRAFQKATALDIEVLAAPTLLEAITFSDHRNFWAKGVSAFMVTDTSFFRNPHYHKSTDTPDTLDFKRMTQVVDGLYGVITNF